MTYHSQYGQDKFLDQKVFSGKTEGFFLELGADDGINGSNTLFFETERNWTGLCIEPRREAFAELIKNRKCKTFNVAVSAASGQKKFLEIPGGLGQLSGLVDTFDPRHLKRIEDEIIKSNATSNVINVESVTLNELLEKNGIDYVDYFSLDTEGGELEILKSIDYKRFPIYCISVENKYEEKNISKFLSSVGYRRMTRLKIDDMFVLRNSPYDHYREPIQQDLKRKYIKLKRTIKNLIGRE